MKALSLVDLYSAYRGWISKPYLSSLRATAMR